MLNKGGARTGAGRKKRSLTEEMISDLSLLNKEEYCIKHSCSELFFYKAHYDNSPTASLSSENPVSSPASVLDGILPFTDYLLEKGYKEWHDFIRQEQSIIDQKLLDIKHKIEIHHCTQIEKIALFDMQTELLREVRKIKDAHEFLTINKDYVIRYLEMIKAIDARKKLVEERVYNTRILHDEFGTTIANKKGE